MAEWFTAVGTILVCVIAIWGEWFKALFFRPRLMLVTLETPPDKISFAQPRYYLHLRVRNSGSVTAHNCRVILRGMTVQIPGNRFANKPVPIPLQFTWSPAEMPPLQREIPAGSEEAIDLGFVTLLEGQRTFQAQFYVTPTGHDYGVPAGERARYFISAVSDNCAPARPQIFEVSWDGNWDDTPDAMRNHLQVSDVTDRVHAEADTRELKRRELKRELKQKLKQGRS